MSYQHKAGAVILKRGQGELEFLARIPEMVKQEPGLIFAYIHLSIGDCFIFHAVGANHEELVYSRFDTSNDAMYLIEYLLRVHKFIAIRISQVSN